MLWLMLGLDYNMIPTLQANRRVNMSQIIKKIGLIEVKNGECHLYFFSITSHSTREIVSVYSLPARNTEPCKCK